MAAANAGARKNPAVNPRLNSRMAAPAPPRPKYGRQRSRDALRRMFAVGLDVDEIIDEVTGRRDEAEHDEPDDRLDDGRGVAGNVPEKQWNRDQNVLAPLVQSQFRQPILQSICFLFRNCHNRNVEFPQPVGIGDTFADQDSAFGRSPNWQIGGVSPT